MLSDLLEIPLTSMEERILAALLLVDRRDLVAALSDRSRVERGIALLELMPREWVLDLCRETFPIGEAPER